MRVELRDAIDVARMSHDGDTLTSLDGMIGLLHRHLDGGTPVETVLSMTLAEATEAVAGIVDRLAASLTRDRIAIEALTVALKAALPGVK